MTSHYETVTYDTELINKLILCVASLVGDIFVLGFHWRSPPHPKYLLLPIRRLCITLHLISGTAEIFSAVSAFFVNDSRIPALTVGVLCIIHVLTALYQTPTVFGSHAVMVPAYLVAIGLHAYFGIQLLIDPRSFTFLINTFLILHIYVWCRIFYAAFVHFRVFEEHRYTVAIMFSGLLIFPATCGYAANLVIILAILIINALYLVVLRPTEVEKNRWFTEHHRETLMSSRKRTTEMLTLGTIHASVLSQAINTNSAATTPTSAIPKGWDSGVDGSKTQKLAPAMHLAGLVANLGEKQAIESMTDRQRARAVFNALDADGNGVLSWDEVQSFFSACGISDSNGAGHELIALLERMGTEEEEEEEAEVEEKEANGKEHTGDLGTGGESKAVRFKGSSNGGTITWHQFANWFTDGYNGRLLEAQITDAADSDEGKARCIFDMLDADKSGYLELIELVHLLTEWGMPESEAVTYLRKFEKNGAGKIGFEVFQSRMKPIYLYAFSMMQFDAERAKKKAATEVALRQHSRKLRGRQAALQKQLSVKKISNSKISCSKSDSSDSKNAEVVVSISDHGDHVIKLAPPPARKHKPLSQCE